MGTVKKFFIQFYYFFVLLYIYLFKRSLYKINATGCWLFRENGWATGFFFLAFGTTLLIFRTIKNGWSYWLFLFFAYRCLGSLYRLCRKTIPLYGNNTQTLKPDTPFSTLNKVIWVASIVPTNTIVERQPLEGNVLSYHRWQQFSRFILYLILCLVTALFTFKNPFNY